MSTFALREKLFSGFEQKEILEQDKTYEEFLKIFQEPDQRVAAEKLQNFSNAQNNINLVNRYFRLSNQAFKSDYTARKLEIPVPISETVGKSGNNKGLVKCTGKVGSKEFQCAVAFGRWSKLKPKLKWHENKAGYFNLIDYLGDLLPKQDSYIGLITFLNGINNGLATDFMDMGQSIYNNFERVQCHPLLIGLYNATERYEITLPVVGMIPIPLHDLLRVANNLDGLLAHNSGLTLVMLMTIAEQLEKINPNLRWAHFAHSEGALITQTALMLLKSNKLADYFKNHLHVYTYGAVLPTPKTAAIAINTYSINDGATYRRMRAYLKELGAKATDYEIHAEKAIEEINNCVNFCEIKHFFKGIFDYLIGDHAFQGLTYQKELSKNIDQLNADFAIYD